MKRIGPSFSEELRRAGLLGLPFSWGDDGVIQFDDRCTGVQREAVLAVYAAHDPAKTSKSEVLEDKLKDATDAVLAEILDKRAKDADAPQAVKDWDAERSKPSSDVSFLRK